MMCGVLPSGVRSDVFLRQFAISCKCGVQRRFVRPMLRKGWRPMHHDDGDAVLPSLHPHGPPEIPPRHVFALPLLFFHER